MNTVFVNPERCTGGKQCEIGCAVIHSQSKNLFWAAFESPLPKPHIHVEPGEDLTHLKDRLLEPSFRYGLLAWNAIQPV